MELTVFGASGAIGKLFVALALKKGHKVRAYVRNPSKLNLSDVNLVILQGELNDADRVRAAIEGCNAVVSLLGPPLKRNYEGTPIVDAHATILAAMQRAGVRRFITLGTPSAKFSQDQRSMATVVPPILGRLLFPKPYQEIVQIGKMMSSSGLDWTLVRIIAPNDKPATGKVKVSYGGTKIAFGISRADIAAFILEAVESGNYLHSMPIIGS